MMMPTVIVLISLLLACISNVHPQIYTGGNASFGYDYGLYIDVAPLFGYQIDRYRVGASPIISYRSYPNSTHVLSYGVRILNQFDIVGGMFAHAELQTLNTEHTLVYPDGNEKKRVWTKALPVGAGYQYLISDRVTFQTMILYDLLQDKKSVYNKPIVRVGLIYRF